MSDIPTLVGLPTYDGKIDCRLVDFFLQCDDVEFYPVMHRQTDVARNIIINYAKMKGYNVIMVDSDSIPHPDTFRKFRQKIEYELCVVCAPYCSAGGSVCVGENSISVPECENKTGWELVNNCGTHTVGYNIKVFDFIDTPYFEYKHNENGTGDPWGLEDTICHKKIVEKGIPIYCNWDLWSGHVKEKVWDKPRSLSRFEKELFLMSQ